MMRVKRDCTPLKQANIRTLRDKGLTFRAIGEIYSVSGTQINYWLNGRKSKHRRQNPGKCEICGSGGQLRHHHWGEPLIGMWLCSRCLTTVDAIERIPGFVALYLELKNKIQLTFSNTLN